MSSCEKPCRSSKTLVCSSCREAKEAEAALREVRDLSAPDFLRLVLDERDSLRTNLSETQTRCSALINKARAMRQTIISLGGEDPGSP